MDFTTIMNSAIESFMAEKQKPLIKLLHKETGLKEEKLEAIFASVYTDSAKTQLSTAIEEASRVASKAESSDSENEKTEALCVWLGKDGNGDEACGEDVHSRNLCEKHLKKSLKHGLISEEKEKPKKEKKPKKDKNGLKCDGFVSSGKRAGEVCGKNVKTDGLYPTKCGRHQTDTPSTAPKKPKAEAPKEDSESDSDTE